MKRTDKFSSPIPTKGGVRYLLNGCGNVASTLTTGHSRAMNIVAPKGGHKEMGVLEIIYERSTGSEPQPGQER